MADDAAVKARMLADLGTFRRDLVSAPQESGHRGPRVDPREQQRAVEAHRTRAEEAATRGSGNGNQADKLAAWNTASNFEQDEVTNQLKDRFSGQGHRAALTRAQGAQAGPSNRYDERSERAENRFGEERSMYLQAHGRAVPDVGRRSNNRQAAASKRDEFGDILGWPRDSRARQMADDSPRGRGRPQVPRSQNPNAAPAPVGRKLFHHDQVVRQSGNTQPTGIPAPASYWIAPASHRHPLHPNGTAPDPSDGPILYNPQAAAVVRNGSPSAQSRTSTSTHGTSKSRRRAKGFDGFENLQHLGNFKGIKTTTLNTRPALKNPAYQGVNFMKALMYAAKPGVDCDDYHETFPERKPLLEMAMNQIFAEIFKDLKEGDERDLGYYLQTHPDRTWMVNGAKQAKEVVENRTPGEIEEFCMDNPSTEALVKMAAQRFQAKPPPEPTNVVKRQDSFVAVGVDNTDTPMPPVTEALPIREVADATMTNIDDNIQTSSPRSSTIILDTPEPVTSPSHLRKRKAAAAAASGRASSSSPLSAKIEHKSAKIDLGDSTAAASKDAQRVGFEALPEASSSSPVAKATNNRAPLARNEVLQSAPTSLLADTKPNGAPHVSESPESTSSSATKVEPDVAAPEAEKDGLLTALFYNSAGSFLDIVQHAVALPVTGTINLTSKNPGFDPTQLANAIENLATSMEARTTDTSKSINGTSLVAYDSDEEL